MTQPIHIGPATAAARPGLAFFELGLRPFFLGAGLQASSSLVWWLLVYAGWLSGETPWPALLHHGHELVFGFGGAAVAGFLLTAVPNWTGTPPLAGVRLAALAGVWLLGRVAFHTPWLSASVVATVDVAFLTLLLVALTPALIRGKPKNWVFAAWIALLVLANLGSHLAVAGIRPIAGIDLNAIQMLHGGIYGLVMLVAILLGRVVPGFTQNALRRAQQPCGTSTGASVELAAKSAVLVTLGAQWTGLSGPPMAALAALTATLLLLRMSGWRSRQVWRLPIVWILHAGHLWLVVGFGLLALQHVQLASWPTPDGLFVHAFTAGVIGTTVLAIMTRAALGHTGRPLIVAPLTTAAYGLVTLGAAIRVLGPLIDMRLYRSAVLLGGGAWALAYLLFCVVYTPILLRPRADGR